MKRLGMTVTLLLLFSGVAQAQQIDLGNVYGLWAPDTLLTGRVDTIEINWNNSGATAIVGWTNGFRFYLDGPGTRSPITIDLDYYVATARDSAFQDGGQFVNEFGVDGLGADTLGLGAFKMFKSGMLPGFNKPMGRFMVTFEDDAHGSQFCVDSCWYYPSNNFLWSDDFGSVDPAWDGPHCWVVFDSGAPPAGSITVTAPNGSEIWTVGTVENITWTSEGVAGNVMIEYTTDGSTWNPVVASTANDGVYEWTIPDAPSATCKVRVSDVAAPTTSDESDDFFTILEAKTITVTAPNGSETWTVGNLENITWTSTGSITNVKLEYSTNNGGAWTEIVASTPNDGVYEWTIPDDPSTQCLVRITEAGGVVSDVSNSVFEIVAAPSLNLTVPNGSEVWSVGSVENISWTSTGVISNVKLEYSTNNGGAWTQIVASTPNDGVYEWTIPNDPSDQCLVRVTDQGGTVSDVSDAVFSIVAAPTLTLTAPNGGETWTVGDVENITWTSTGSITNVQLEYSTNNGGAWTTIEASTANDGVYEWTIPNDPSTQCLVRITEAGGVASDVSDAVFTIVAAPTLTLTVPNGGETWMVGAVENITWTTTGTVGNVQLEYSTNNGGAWTTIEASTANDGVYEWTIPDDPSTQCLVRISEVGGVLSDVSDAVWTITSVATLALTAPNGGEVWYIGNTENITWSSSGGIGNVMLEYTTDGSTWTEITASTDNDGVFEWLIPNDPSTTCKVRISEVVGALTDESDGFFTIAVEPTITVTAPNGGEIWIVGTVENISWTSTGDIADVMLEYTTDGSTFNEIEASTANDGLYEWTIPNAPSATCKVRVSDVAGPAMDESDAFFSISSPIAFILVATPPSLIFNTEIGVNPDPQSVEIAEAGAAMIDFAMGTTPSWFSVAPTGGETPQMVEFSVDVTGLGAGPHVDSVAVTSDSAENDPIYVVVHLNITTPEPEGDTMWVGATGAAQGQTGVAVPVDFTVNSCDVYEAWANLAFDSDNLTLDSVVFDAADVFSNAAAIVDNVAGTVDVTMSSTIPAEMIPVGTDGVFMTLFFTVAVGAPEGFYPVTTYGPLDPNPGFGVDCGIGLDTSAVVFSPLGDGGVSVEQLPNTICGHVLDPDSIPIPGATVELWVDYPHSGASLGTTTDAEGLFEFIDFIINPYDLYAHKEGYYPNSIEDIYYGEDGFIIILTPVAEVVETPYALRYYCGDNTYFDSPLPVGSVVDAKTKGGVHCGTFYVHTEGQYGEMFVYKDDGEGFPGAEENDTLFFFINNTPAATVPDPVIYWPPGTQNLDAFQVCLSGGQFFLECELVPGWNLVSWNLDTDSDDLLSVMGSIEGDYDLIAGFEGGYMTYDPDLPGFSTLTEADHLSGYWIKANKATTLRVTGFPVPAGTPIPLAAGWNLVSYLPDFTLTPAEALSAIPEGELIVALGFIDDYLVYRPDPPGFNTLEIMSTCFGYWLKVTTAGELVYPDAIPVSDRSIIPNRYDVESQPIASSADPEVVQSTSYMNLYSWEVRLDGEVIPAGVTITAHRLDGTRIGSYRLTEPGKFGFMPVYAQQLGEQFYLAVDGVKTNDVFSYTGFGDKAEVVTLSAKSGSGNPTLPEQYWLAQNYPNPFNPTTTIQFNMGQSGPARIEVFNLLGQLVAVPFDGVAAKGINEVAWDGRNSAGTPVSSGVYFYRLAADTFTETRKMTLLK